jgi:hypothetical protein
MDHNKEETISDTFSEEDLHDYTTESTDSDSVSQIESSIASSCTNSDPYTLESYTDDEPGLLIIKTMNSKGKFEKGECITRETLISILEGEERTIVSWSRNDPTENTPQNVMSIWSTPKNRNKAGYGGTPTGKWVFKLPNLMYITLGSLKRIMKNPDVNEWFAVPLYNNKARRVGNVLGVIGMSMNHGQLPGFKIHKLFTKQEIGEGVKVEETKDDYPLDIAVNGDYEVAEESVTFSIYSIFHSIATYHIDKIDDVYM